MARKVTGETKETAAKPKAIPLASRPAPVKIAPPKPEVKETAPVLKETPQKKAAPSLSGIKEATGIKEARETAPVPKEAPQKKAASSPSKIKKEFVKGKNVCRVTFRLPKAAVPGGKGVCVVGDFNKWRIHANPMEKQENGDHTLTLDLKPGKEYQFRYLIGETRWENDWNADKYMRSPYGDCDNSVVVVKEE